MITPGLAEPARRRFMLPDALILSSLAALVVFAMAAVSAAVTGSWQLDGDPDSNMRLLQVRDWLAGQGWYDVTQQRLGIDDGTDFHWTRLADLLPAGLILLLAPLLGAQVAETLAVSLAPPLLFVSMTFAMGWAAWRLAAAFGATTRIAVIATAVLAVQLPTLHLYFRPGLIDHHNLQLIGLLVFLGGCCGARTFQSGLIAAAGLVFGLVVGVDGLVIIAGATVGLGVLWAFNPMAEREFLRGFGIGTLGLCLLAGPLFIPAPHGTAWCDSWTIPVAAIFSAFGIMLLLLAWPLSQLPGPSSRLLVAGSVGALVLAGLILAFPACRNPVPLDDWRIDLYWMPFITENYSAAKMSSYDPTLVSVFLPTLVGLGTFGLALKRGWITWQSSLPLVLANLSAFILALLFWRAVPLMLVTTVPLLAASLVPVTTSTRPLVRLAGWVGSSPFLAMAIVVAVLTPFKPATGEPSVPVDAGDLVGSHYCLDRATVAAIKELPRGLIVTGMGASELLLRHTRHSAAFAGYHRNREANIWVMDWLNAPPERAQTMLARHEVSYVAICPKSRQWDVMAHDNPGSLIDSLLKNRPPDWMAATLPMPGGGMVWTVRSGL